MLCRRLATLVLGLDAYERVLFEHADGRILRIIGAVIELCDGTMNVRSRTFARRFADFADYKGYLLETLSAVFENGSSPLRRRPLRPITTVSSGYDSAACAALAATLGCREALTLQTGRSGRPDTGLAVGRALGLEVHEFERVCEGAPITRYDEAEFLATGMGGEDLPFAAFEPALQGRIVLTGFYGGRIWKAEPNAALARDDLSGSSLIEFRLRTGFVSLPVLFIGCARAAEIRRIGLSDEMAAWRLSTDYDKPVLRRIVEEAGVPRHLFGQRKEAASSLVFQQSHLLSRPTWQALQAFRRDRSSARMRRMQTAWWVRYYVGPGLHKLARIIGIKSAHRWIERLVIGEDWRIFEHSSPWTELAFRWGLERIRPRYRTPQGPT
jgi:hypothetical protein